MKNKSAKKGKKRRRRGKRNKHTNKQTNKKVVLAKKENKARSRRRSRPNLTDSNQSYSLLLSNHLESYGSKIWYRTQAFLSLLT